MARTTSLFRIALTGAALTIAATAMAQTSSAPASGSPTVQAPKQEGLMARTKAKAQARIKRMKQNWANNRARTAACRNQAESKNIPPQNRAEFIRTCAGKMAVAKGSAAGPNILPALLLSPESQKPNLSGMSTTGEGGEAIDSQKKK
jgi:hypothetical protein